MAVQIGRRRKRLVLIPLVSLFFLTACGGGKSSDQYPVRLTADGAVDLVLVKKLYDMKCALCHGHDGAQQFAGAKNLAMSTLDKTEVVHRIAEGKGSMPPHKDVLSVDQMNALADFVFTLR